MSEATAVQEKTDNDDRKLDVEHVTLVILSTVARMQGQRGAHAMVAVMRGSRRQRICEAGFDELPVYGLLEWISRRRLRAMVEALIRSGLIARGRHRVLGLTCTGSAVMIGEIPLPKAVRESVERAYRTVPRNSTVTRYGQNSPTIKSTLELTRQGLSPAEVARRRGLATSTVVEHIYALIGHGADIDLEPHVDPDLLAELTELNCRWKPGDSPVPVVEQLDTEVDWGELKLHLLHLFLSSKQGEEQTRRGA